VVAGSKNGHVSRTDPRRGCRASVWRWSAPVADARQQRRSAPNVVPTFANELSIPFEKSVLGGKAEFYSDRQTGKSEKTVGERSPQPSTTVQKIGCVNRGSRRGGTPGDLILNDQESTPHPYFERNQKTRMATGPDNDRAQEEPR